jgi:hypothetical protein
MCEAVIGAILTSGDEATQPPILIACRAQAEGVDMGMSFPLLPSDYR